MRKNVDLRLPGALLLLALFANPAQPAGVDSARAPREPGALSGDVVTQFDKFLQSNVYTEGADPTTHAPGLILLVDTPGGRYLRAAGVASLENGAPLRVDDRLEIGSNSKSFTVVLLLQLQEEGVLTLDDSLSKWLPGWAARIPNSDQVTLRHLAQHTSGIWDYGDPLIGAAADDSIKLEQGYSPQQLVQYAIDNGTPDFAPGEEGKWKYGNTGYILLGMIIEKATGQSLGALYRQRIFDPLGLETAALVEAVPQVGEIVDGYWWTDDAQIRNTTNWNASQGWAAGGIAMTAEELLTFAKALAAGKLFRKPETLALMLTFDPDGMGGQVPYGLGLMDFSRVGAPGSWGHAGQTAGFQSLWYTNPDTGVTVIGLTNSARYSAYSFLRVGFLLALGSAKASTGESVASASGAAESPRFERLDKCFAQLPEDVDVQYDMDCGYVVVPEFHGGQSTRELRLGITRLKARDGTVGSPLFMLAGGPGHTEVSPDYLRLFQPALLGGILQSRDIVLIEQRGTEHTDTYLDCPESRTAPWAAYEKGLFRDEAERFVLGAIERCIEAFRARGINLDAYNSRESAADINDVRQAMDYDRIVYYGASYGAQLGQHVMRDFPGILEAVVLDGAEGLSRKSWVENRALDAQWGIDHLAALCRADEQCIEDYDIPALVEAVLALFDDGPLPFTYTAPDDPSLTIRGEVTVQDMAGFIYGRQGDRIGAMSLPRILDQLSGGGAEQVALILGSVKSGQLVASRDATSSPMATIMHLAMVCSDDPVKSVDEVNVTGVGRYAELFGREQGETYAELCQRIKVKELPDSTDVNATTNVPTLLLSGDLDVATPAFRSKEVADALPKSTLVVFPGRTHVQIAAVNLCAAQIMTSFVLHPKDDLDMSCTENSPLLGFLLLDGSISRTPR